MDRESQLARDARIIKLWGQLDTRKEGHLDLEGLRDGLRRINHRKLCHLGGPAKIFEVNVLNH